MDPYLRLIAIAGVIIVGGLVPPLVDRLAGVNVSGTLPARMAHSLCLLLFGAVIVAVVQNLK